MPEIGADPPEDHADLVFRIVLDRQAADHDKAAPILDLVPDLVDDRPQRRDFEMLALQVVEAETGRFYPAHGALDVAQVARIELDRIIRRRFKVGDFPDTGVVYPRAVHRVRGTSSSTILFAYSVLSS